MQDGPEGVTDDRPNCTSRRISHFGPRATPVIASMIAVIDLDAPASSRGFGMAAIGSTVTHLPRR
jgi:hypothetical protein